MLQSYSKVSALRPIVSFAALGAAMVITSSVAQAQDDFGTGHVTDLDRPPPEAAPGARAEDGASFAQKAAIDKPPSGVGLLVAGGILTGIGVTNLATSPICKTSLVDHSAQDPCLAGSLIVGGTLTLVGVPLLIVGASQRSRYNEWKRNFLGGLDLRVGPGGVAFGWQRAF